MSESPITFSPLLVPCRARADDQTCRARAPQPDVLSPALQRHPAAPVEMRPLHRQPRDALCAAQQRLVCSAGAPHGHERVLWCLNEGLAGSGTRTAGPWLAMAVAHVARHAGHGPLAYAEMAQLPRRRLSRPSARYGLVRLAWTCIMGGAGSDGHGPALGLLAPLAPPSRMPIQRPLRRACALRCAACNLDWPGAQGCRHAAKAAAPPLLHHQLPQALLWTCEDPFWRPGRAGLARCRCRLCVTQRSTPL